MASNLLWLRLVLSTEHPREHHTYATASHLRDCDRDSMHHTYAWTRTFASSLEISACADSRQESKSSPTESPVGDVNSVPAQWCALAAPQLLQYQQAGRGSDNHANYHRLTYLRLPQVRGKSAIAELTRQYAGFALCPLTSY